MRAGRLVRLITCAMVNVLPEPVTPSSTWSRSYSPTPATSASIAVGWSPLGSYSDTSSKWMPPSDLSGRSGRCGVQASPFLMLGSPATSSAASEVRRRRRAGHAEGMRGRPRRARIFAAPPAPCRGRRPGRARTCRRTSGRCARPGHRCRPRSAPAPPRSRTGGFGALRAGLSSAARCSPSGVTSGFAAFDLPVGLGPRGLAGLIVSTLVSSPRGRPVLRGLGIGGIWQGATPGGRATRVR